MSLTVQISEDQKRVWDVAIAVVTLVGAIAGALFAGWQYLDSKDKDRVQHTLDYLSRFNQSPLAESRNVFEDASIRILDENQARLAAARNGKDKGRIYAVIVQHSVAADPKLERAVRDLIEFYEQLAVCLDEELCSRRVTDRYFRTQATALVDNMTPFICGERARWHDNSYAEKTVRFAFGEDAGDICKP